MSLPPIEEDILRLERRGRFWSGRAPITMPGAPNQCHANSSACWEANRDRVLPCTGYALSRDGIWRQHSWCVQTASGAVIETTERRALYFGFQMTQAEARAFAALNS